MDFDVILIYMRKDSEFHDYVLYDLLGDNLRITSRKMFGGYGIYLNGVIFGIIAEDVLYFKVDDSNQEEFVSRGSKMLTYLSKGKEVPLPYWEVPADVLEDRGMLLDWMFTSVEVTIRGNKR